MTMVELAVAMLIFSILVIVAFGITASTTRAAADKIAESTLQVKGERTLKLITETLSPSAQLGVDANGAGLTYYVPVDIDGSGTVLSGGTGTGSGLLEYGATNGSTSTNGTMRFSYVASTLLNENLEVVDLNGDGDRLDIFDIGYVQQSTSISGDLPKIVGLTNIAQRQGNYGTTIDVDNGASGSGRLFNLPSGSRVLQVSIWLMTISEDRLPHLVQCKSYVFLRNQ